MRMHEKLQMIFVENDQKLCGSTENSLKLVLYVFFVLAFVFFLSHLKSKLLHLSTRPVIQVAPSTILGFF